MFGKEKCETYLGKYCISVLPAGLFFLAVQEYIVRVPLFYVHTNRYKQ